MKARVKATGEIVEVEKTILRGIECYINKIGEKIGSLYMESDLDFGFNCDYALDYWEKLKHQYAGMAMQGILANKDTDVLILRNEEISFIANRTIELATALVEKLKEK